MILIDFTQTMIAGLMAQLKSNNGEVNENLLRHMILNTLRTYTRNYGEEYGDVVLCADEKHNWRKDFFALYKVNRKRARDKTGLDWNQLFDSLHQVREEIKDNFPWRMMQVPSCEADDIIAVITKHFAHTENILIVSGDKDFQQLQKYPNVKQWSPNTNKWVTCADPALFLKEHILRGDKSDGVPNFLSRDECISENIRQVPLRKGMLDTYLRIDIDKDDKYYRNYCRNKTLIDLDEIPTEIEIAILEEFASIVPVTGRVYDYLRNNKLNDLMDNVEDFRL